EESADEPKEIEIRQSQEAEYHHAAKSNKKTDDEVTGNEAANHQRNLSQGDIRGASMLLAKQLNCLGADVFLPAQHEIDKNRYEGDHGADFSHCGQMPGNQSRAA